MQYRANRVDRPRMFFGNQYIGRIRVSGNKLSFWERFIKKVKHTLLWVLFIQVAIWSGIGLVQYGKITAEPIIVHAKEIVEVPIEVIPPVMERIAKCESGSNHYKNGQVLIRSNKDGSVDIGYYQINSVHNKQATLMGLDLTKEEDNKTFAMHLYKTIGTEPWYSSKACWNK
jgi:hypothetical protein